MRFSEHYNLHRQQSELDFIDIDPNKDLPLFIDPYAFSKRSDLWSVTCHNEIVSFFQAAIDSIRTGHESHAQVLLNNLSEPKDTCLGLSSGNPVGKGVSGKQAIDLYEKLAQSQAVQTGLLTELSECELLIVNIGHDKISDITTNIIRRHLINYTRNQCILHGIPMQQVASERMWDNESALWVYDYVELPVIHGKKIVLVPKASVRWKMSLDHKEYYWHYVLNFLQGEHLRAGSGLVKVLRSGKRVVYKKDLAEINPLSKEYLYEFSRRNPTVLEAYKRVKGQKANDPMRDNEILQDINERVIAEGIKARLLEIPPGSDHATQFHHLMIGAAEFIFYPNLIYPIKEFEINEGRKRIDIAYTNSALNGFFYRIHTAHNVASNMVMIECKNYSSDPANPELDQMAGRFSTNRGRFGLLVARSFEDRDLFIRRCKDTAVEGRGFIIPLGDSDIMLLLDSIIKGRRQEIDWFLENEFQKLIN